MRAGSRDTAVLTITINGANDAPVMTSGATASTPENVSTIDPSLHRNGD